MTAPSPIDSTPKNVTSPQWRLDPESSNFAQKLSESTFNWYVAFANVPASEFSGVCASVRSKLPTIVKIGESTLDIQKTTVDVCQETKSSVSTLNSSVNAQKLTPKVDNMLSLINSLNQTFRKTVSSIDSYTYNLSQTCMIRNEISKLQKIEIENEKRRVQREQKLDRQRLRQIQLEKQLSEQNVSAHAAEIDAVTAETKSLLAAQRKAEEELQALQLKRQKEMQRRKELEQARQDAILTRQTTQDIQELLEKERARVKQMEKENEQLENGMNDPSHLINKDEFSNGDDSKDVDGSVSHAQTVKTPTKTKKQKKKRFSRSKPVLMDSENDPTLYESSTVPTHEPRGIPIVKSAFSPSPIIITDKSLSSPSTPSVVIPTIDPSTLITHADGDGESTKTQPVTSTAPAPSTQPVTTPTSAPVPVTNTKTQIKKSSSDTPSTPTKTMESSNIIFNVFRPSQKKVEKTLISTSGWQQSAPTVLATASNKDVPNTKFVTTVPPESDTFQHSKDSTTNTPLDTSTQTNALPTNSQTPTGSDVHSTPTAVVPVVKKKRKTKKNRGKKRGTIISSTDTTVPETGIEIDITSIKSSDSPIKSTNTSTQPQPTVQTTPTKVDPAPTKPHVAASSIENDNTIASTVTHTTSPTSKTLKTTVSVVSPPKIYPVQSSSQLPNTIQEPVVKPESIESQNIAENLLDLESNPLFPVEKEKNQEETSSFDIGALNLNINSFSSSETSTVSQSDPQLDIPTLLSVPSDNTFSMSSSDNLIENQPLVSSPPKDTGTDLNSFSFENIDLGFFPSSDSPPPTGKTEDSIPTEFNLDLDMDLNFGETETPAKKPENSSGSGFNIDFSNLDLNL